MSAISALENHLWQTTLIWLLVSALMPGLRQNSAKIRSSLWMMASLKFLVPFSLLSWTASVIHKLGENGAASQIRTISGVAQRVETPFLHNTVQMLSSSSDIGGVGIPSHSWYLVVLFSIWLVGASCVAIPWMMAWLRLRRRVRQADAVGVFAGIPIITIQGNTEPAVFGCFRPVLLIPSALEQRLTTEQMKSILTHELCHVRRRDNLQATIHMLVNVLFWFHPAVWVIGKQLLKERELACDEAVLAEGGEPILYAKSLLQVCNGFFETAPGCLATIGGAELKDRICRILADRSSIPLSRWHKGLLSVAACGALILPALAGVTVPELPKDDSSATQLPAFDVVSIKENNSGSSAMRMATRGDTFSATNVTAGMLIQLALHVKSFQVVSGPGWINNKRYDISARIPSEAMGLPLQEKAEQAALMVRKMLEERFDLRYHISTKQLPEYVLEGIGKSSALQESSPTDKYTFLDDDQKMIATATSMVQLAEQLSTQLDRVVVDDTLLKGRYNFSILYADPNAPGKDDNVERKSQLLAAVREQLGLKIISKNGPVKVVVIDHIAPPTAN